MKQTNKPKFGNAKELIRDMHGIVEGHIKVSQVRPVAVYKLNPHINPNVTDTNNIVKTIGQYRNALNNLQPGEQVQIIVKTKPYDLDSKLKLYDDLTQAARKELSNELNNAIESKNEAATGRLKDLLSDNYIKNKYPSYLKAWIKEFIVLNNVCELEYYLMHSYMRHNLDLKINPDVDPVKVFIKNKDFLDSNKETLISNMRRFGDLKLLDREQILNLVSDCVNDSAENIDMGYANENTLARTAFERTDNYIKLGEKYCKTVYVSDLPPEQASGFLKALFFMKKQFRLSIFFEGISQETVTKRLEQELKIASSQQSGFIKNYATEELTKRYDALLQRKAAGEVSFVKFGLYITLIDDTKEELNDTALYVKQLFSGLPFYKGDYEQLKCFKSSLPFNINYGRHSYTIPTDDAISTFMFFKYDTSTKEGGAFLGTNRLHQPVLYYPHSEDFTNGNMVIVGLPGSGKSFSINTILANLGAWSQDVFIVDKSKSYEFLCNIQKGQYLTMDLEGKYCVNIFDCIDYDKDLIDATSNDNDITQDGDVSANKIAQIVGFFKTIISSESASEWQLERALIENTINETYKKMKVNKDGKIDPVTIPTLSDFHKNLDTVAKEKTEWKHQLAMIKEKLNSYVGKGQYAKFVDRQTNIDLTSSFIVFDTSGLPEDVDLQSLAVYIISTFLTKKFKQNKKRGRKQLLMIDETWTLARFEAGVTFLLNLSKRSRHMGLVCAFATQQMADFLNNPDAAQIFKNVEIFIMFQQSTAEEALSNMQKALELNDQEKALIGSLELVKGEYSDAFVKMGKLGGNLVKIRPNPALYWIATTDKNDAPIKQQVLKECNYNYEQAMLKLAGG